MQILPFFVLLARVRKIHGIYKRFHGVHLLVVWEVRMVLDNFAFLVHQFVQGRERIFPNIISEGHLQDEVLARCINSPVGPLT